MSEGRFSEIADPEERRRAIALVDELAARSGTSTCPSCQVPVCDHQYVMNAAMGFKDAPRCVACLAAALEQPTAEFFHRVTHYVDDRACFRAAWEWADAAEGTVGVAVPKCVAAYHAAATEPETQSEPAVDAAQHGVPTATWDAGDMSCGDLVLQLRIRLNRLEPGQVLSVRASDPAAPEDLPAWCNLTGHELIVSDHPNYHLRRRNG